LKFLQARILPALSGNFSAVIFNMTNKKEQRTFLKIFFFLLNTILFFLYCSHNSYNDYTTTADSNCSYNPSVRHRRSRNSNMLRIHGKTELDADGFIRADENDKRAPA